MATELDEKTPGSFSEGSADILTVGSKRLKIEIVPSNGGVKITAIEIATKDLFSGVVSSKSLGLRGTNTDRLIQFIMSALFEETESLKHCAGFITTKDKFDPDKLDDSDQFNRIVKKSYERGHHLAIGIILCNKWQSELRCFLLEWVEREELDKMRDVITEMRQMIEHLQYSLGNSPSRKLMHGRWTTNNTSTPRQWNTVLIKPPPNLISMEQNNSVIKIIRSGIYEVHARISWSNASGYYGQVYVTLPDSKTESYLTYQGSSSNCYHTVNMHHILTLPEGSTFYVTGNATPVSYGIAYQELIIKYLDDL